MATMILRTIPTKSDGLLKRLRTLVTSSLSLCASNSSTAARMYGWGKLENAAIIDFASSLADESELANEDIGFMKVHLLPLSLLSFPSRLSRSPSSVG